MPRVTTIGFTTKSAEVFFALLKRANVQRLLDVRLNNSGQLAGFSKKDDLAYFLREIAGIEYLHLTSLAPTQDILDAYKKAGGAWDEYEKRFLSLMEQRHIEREVTPSMIDGACLLCSEDKPHCCHRRLVVEYLRQQWGSLDIQHLV